MATSQVGVRFTTKNIKKLGKNKKILKLSETVLST